MSGKEQGCNSGVEILIGFQKVKKRRKLSNKTEQARKIIVVFGDRSITLKNRGKYLVGVFDQKNAQ